MAELSLMASAAFSLPPVFQEQTTCRASKEVSTTFPCFGNRRDIFKSSHLLVSPLVVEKGLPMNLLPMYNPPQGTISMAEKPVLVDMPLEKPVLVDVQDACHDSVLFSIGIAEQCARREKILKFLFSGSNEEKVMDTSLLSEFMGLRTVAVDIFDMFSLSEVGEHDSDHTLPLAGKFHIPKPMLEFISASSNKSNITVHPDGRMLLTDVESEIKDLLSIFAEFNVLKSFTTSNRQSMVVPYFTRSRGGHARSSSQGSLLSNQIVAPSRNPENIKPKPSAKKKVKNASRERVYSEKNYFRACENLLSVIVDKKRTSIAVHSLKKSGSEITHLLSHSAACIAGIGFAILLSVTCKAPNGRVSLNTAKFLNIGLGIGFFCLSWSVTRLRDTVAYISKSMDRLKVTEEEIVMRVDESVSAVLYRAAALVAIALLRFA